MNSSINIEGAYTNAKLMMHCYRDGYRAYWPSWYRGEGELVYYQRAFEEKLLPEGLAPLMLRGLPTGISPEMMETAMKRARGFSQEQLKKANGSKNAAWEAYGKGDTAAGFDRRSIDYYRNKYR